MNNTLDNLQPAAVWKYFGELMNIPRPSKHEAKVSAFLQDFGRKLGFETLADEVGNVLIRKPAAPGYENAPRVCLQAHIDMVCEKNGDKEFDFLTQPIQAYVEDGWLIGDGTTWCRRWHRRCRCHGCPCRQHLAAWPARMPLHC